MPDIAVTPCAITVGRDAPEPVSPARLDFYQWLSATLTEQPTRVVPSRGTVYVTSEELRSQGSEIRQNLARVLPTSRGQRVLIIDLAENQYYLLRESLLFHIAEVAQEWIKASPSRTLVVLLPGMPPQTSTFWIPFHPRHHDRRTGRLLVLAPDDVARAWGRLEDKELNEGFRAEYHRREAPTTISLRERFATKVVRRPGHYDFTGRSVPHCARYYFDVEYAAKEIGMLAVRWLEDRIIPSLAPDDKEHELTLVCIGTIRDALHEAIVGAAAAMGCRWLDLDPRDLSTLPPFPGPVALFFKVIHTGRTYRRVVTAMRQHGVRLADQAFAVMVTDPAVETTGPLPLEVLYQNDRRKTPRAECEQCRIGLRHTRLKDAHHTLRSYDAWSVLLETPWGSEQFGPRDVDHLIDYVPDLGTVFERYGDWIAYKIIERCRALGVQSDAVFVCPDEERIGKLITSFGVLMENRQVTVRVPRLILNHAWDDAAFTASRGEEWERQLRHLGERGRRVVMLDEFRARGITARAMRTVLQRFHVEPLAYIPVLDFSGQRDLDGLSTYPLYRIQTSWGAT